MIGLLRDNGERNFVLHRADVGRAGIKAHKTSAKGLVYSRRLTRLALFDRPPIVNYSASLTVCIFPSNA